MQNSRYPKIQVRSKNELAKRLASRGFSESKAAELINDSLANFDTYWKDHPGLSRPDAEKWVRDASGTKLGRLLKLIDRAVLKPHDPLLPNFIFGGISGKDHKAAVRHLLGKRRGRVLLKLDIARFYEQISLERVEQFFALKASCGKQGATLLGKLCCVPFGAKNQPQARKTIARGFATSSRLAVWCNLDVFLKLERLVMKELKGKDPRIAIYVDDIGITASRATKEELMRLYPKVEAILGSDAKQKLPLNKRKTEIIFHNGDTYNVDGSFKGKWGFEHLGLQMNRNSLTPGSKARWRFADITHRLNTSTNRQIKLRRSKRGLSRYTKYIQK
jgi:hypothetical protein